jgi:anti-sigma factor RsiW
VAAVLLVGGLAGGAWWGLLREPSAAEAWSDHLAALAADHERAVVDESLVSSDVEAVRDWLTERVSFGVHVPDMPDARLAGARLCFVNGQRSAVVEYEVDDRDVSFYLMPARGDAPTVLSPAEFVRGADSGYEFIAWQGAGLVHALVGSVSEARLRRMARSCLDLPAADGTRP